MEAIYIKSPRNGAKVMIGEIDFMTRIAYFTITEPRFFREANAFGVDLKVFNRKSIRWCNDFIFDLWDGRRFKIPNSEFVKNAWCYPPAQKEGYKALAPDFTPKLVIGVDVAAKLNTWDKEKEDEKIVKLSMM